ncbi:protein NLRC3-like, partial [Osmerus eperlanus]|uniref:protein NLRC3-like n=1 Tax=Osmerus eperlanus TaxID=29151 RepID=UPI002E141720
MATINKTHLLKTLEQLGEKELKTFKWYLQDKVLDGFESPKSRLEGPARTDTVDRMEETYTLEGALKITVEILRKMDQNNLAERLMGVSGAEEAGGNSLTSCLPQEVQGSSNTTETGGHAAAPGGNPSEPHAATHLSSNKAQDGSIVVAPVLNADVGGNVTYNITTINNMNTVDHQKKEEASLIPQQSTSSPTQLYEDKERETNRSGEENGVLELIDHFKLKLKEKFQEVFEGIAKKGNATLLNEIYTDLYITEGESGEVNKEHEVRQIETASRKSAKTETAITCNNIFKPSAGRNTRIRIVLTKGVAGIGKTVSVQKFITDWAEGLANQEIQFIFPLPFRELNLLDGEEFSLMKLVHHFFSETRQSGISNYDKYKVLFVFDGLDECRLPLAFKKNKSWCDVTESTSVDVLLTNLIRGKLLPSALIWITTRPAAANQIPSECVDLVTEVRGFNDPQKDEYIMKRCSDEILARRIISHIKTSRTLYIMCHIPVFSWITVTVLEHMLRTEKKEKLPKTLTEMYTQFLVLQTIQKKVKYHGKTETDSYWDEDSIQSIQSLGKLAFHQLIKGNLIFYEKDLTECGIDVCDASVYSGVFTQIFREDRKAFQKKVFCFVHLSFQEFLAAVFVFLSFINNNENLMSKNPLASSFNKLLACFTVKPEVRFYKSAVDKALQSKNGQLDLFLRFLLGLSMESNQTDLQGLLTQTRSNTQSHEETVKYIKEKIRKNPSPERCMNLFHCLNELNDHSLVEEIQHYLSSGSLSSEKKLSSTQWSALVFVLLTSEEEMDVFDLKKYSRSEEGLLRLLPVVKNSKAAQLSGCHITEEGCASLSSALKSTSFLRQLDLNNNDLKDAGMKLLSAGLGNPLCKLET